MLMYPRFPRTVFAAFAVAAFLGACSAARNVEPPSTVLQNESAGGAFGTAATSDASRTWARVEVTIKGKSAPNIPVAESTPASNANPRPGTPIAKKRTDADGYAVFRNLASKQIYCWVATLGQGQASYCASAAKWQTQTIIVGT